MALTRTARGVGSNAVAATTLVISPNATIPAGDLAVAFFSYDNAGTAGADPFSTLVDSAGNTWTVRQAALNDPGAASAGIVVMVATSLLTTQLTTGSTITLTFTTSVTAKAWALESWHGSAGIPSYLSSNKTTGSSAAPTLTTTSITSGDGLSAAVGGEWGTTQVITDDADTASGSWTAGQKSSVGTTTSGVGIVQQAKVTTGSAVQTYNPTLSISSDWGEVWISIDEVPFPPIDGTLDVIGTGALGQAAGVNLAGALAVAGSGAFALDGTVTGSGTPTERQSAARSSAAASTTISLPLPAAPVAGNLLVFAMAGDKNTGALTLAGFTQVFEILGASVSLYLYMKVSDGSEQTINPTWATSSVAGNTAYYAEIEAVGGGAWEVDTSASTAYSDSVVSSRSSGTTGTVVDAGLAWAVFGVDSSQSVTGARTYSNGFVALYEAITLGGRGAVFIATASAPAGSTYETTFGYTGTADQISGAIAIFSRAAGGTTQNGALDLVGAASVDRAGTVTYAGASAVTGTGLIGETGGLVLAGAQAVAGTGALAQAGGLLLSGTLGLAGAGTLGQAGVLKLSGGMAVMGTGLAGQAPAVTYAGDFDPVGTGAFGAAGGIVTSATLAIAGSGALGPTAKLTYAGGLATLGSGFLGMTTAGQIPGTLALTGTDAFGAVGSVTLAASASLAGSGLLGASAGVVRPSTLNVAGSGVLGTAPLLLTAGSAAFVGAGTISEAPIVGWRGSLGVAGAGTLSGSPGGTVGGTLSIAGSGAIAELGGLALAGGLALVGSGSAGASALVLRQTLLTILGTGSFGQVPTLISTGAPLDPGAIAIVRVVVPRALSRGGPSARVAVVVPSARVKVGS